MKKLGNNNEIIFIDYLSIITPENNSVDRHLQVAEISRSLKALARELEIPIVALSQVSRDSEGKAPHLASIRESGAIEQDADVVTFIYRDEVYNKEENNPNRGQAEIILAKHRNGPTGDVPLAFMHACTRFENLARETFVPEPD